MSAPDANPAPRRGRPRKNAPVQAEKGVAGLSVSGGQIRDARDYRFRGREWRNNIHEMIDTDPVIGGIFLGIDLKMVKALPNLAPADDSAEAKRQAEFVESCLGDMAQPFPVTRMQIGSMLPWGWSWFEQVYKLRMGPLPKDQVLSDGSRRQPPASKFDDGFIGWHKWGHRHPDTLHSWDFAEDGTLRGMNQRDPNSGDVANIPIQRSLLFRPRYFKGNPEGRSTLTNTYRAWYFKRQIEQLEAMGLERELTGMLVLYLTENLLAPEEELDEADLAARNKYIEMAEDVRADPTTVAFLPSVYDDKGNQLIKFQIVESTGQRQYDTDAIIARWDQRVAFATLAQFMLLGTEKVGSYALSSTQAALFTDALNTWNAAIADVINEFAIRRLVEVNGWDPAFAPTLSFAQITDASIKELADYLETLGKSGATIWPNQPLLENLLAQAGLPNTDLPPHQDKLAMQLELQRRNQEQQRQNGQQGGDQSGDGPAQGGAAEEAAN